MSRLFKRTASLTIYEVVKGSFFRTTNSVTIRDLRIRFEIDKNLDKEPNRAVIEIYNLAERSRALVQKPRIHVRLEAGFDGETERIFSGDLRFAYSKRDATEWVTRLECGDGERAIRHARLNRSYRAGVTARDLVKEVAKQFGLKAKVTGKEFDRQFVAGLALHGSASRALTAAMARFGMTWSIQDGQLVILRDLDTVDDAPIVVSSDTGMIGSPELASPEKPKKPPTLHASISLHPAIQPGGRIDVQSRSVEGLFKVESCRHIGDTHGSEWETSVEAKPL
jgi:hypothetical protein